MSIRAVHDLPGWIIGQRPLLKHYPPTTSRIAGRGGARDVRAHMHGVYHYPAYNSGPSASLDCGESAAHCHNLGSYVAKT